jgi:predicted short-subunit dehydrogenase-like oxidoreductase (DUF2520 family)
MSEIQVGIVGRGRLGTALSDALRAAGHNVSGPAQRGELPAADVIVLCVPDAEIGAAAAAVAGAARLVGHTSGATPLSALDPSRATGLFGLHPLQTFTGSPGDAQRFSGCRCAIGGSTSEALETAVAIARSLGMEPFELSDAQRPAYHAAASIASNYLVTLEAAAERLAATAGLEREHLVALVRATVENWAALGPGRALTGPLVRGDEDTVARQRAAVAERTPDLLDLFDALAAATRALAGEAAIA